MNWQNKKKQVYQDLSALRKQLDFRQEKYATTSTPVELAEYVLKNNKAVNSYWYKICSTVQYIVYDQFEKGNFR